MVKHSFGYIAQGFTRPRRDTSVTDSTEDRADFPLVKGGEKSIQCGL